MGFRLKKLRRRLKKQGRQLILLKRRLILFRFRLGIKKEGLDKLSWAPVTI